MGFLTANGRWLAVGAALTFASSYGQTFFISVYANDIRAAFELSHGQWGGIYTLGTFASALAMLWAGPLADRFRVKWLGLAALAGLAAFCLSMALAPAVWALPLVIFGLRFCGQGMMGHIAMVAMGRWFRRNRGKAVSIASTGFSLGEALLPFAFLIVAGWIGWRASWGIAALATLAVAPILIMLLREERTPGLAGGEVEPAPGMEGRHWSRRQALSHWLFWLMVPAFLCPSVFTTALFFQHAHLAETKGWAHESFVALFPVFTVTGLLALYGAGFLVDRLGSDRLAPVFLLPSALGFVIFAGGESLWAAAAGFAAMGVMQGASAVVAGAFWPEFYGARHLGAVRSAAMSLMVFGSAIGPGVTGWLIDRGVEFEEQMLAIAIIIVAASALAGLAMRWARPLLPLAPEE